ncbi:MULTISPECIES: M15 family metallopeptidase [Citricoccus]|uniref:M15 family metallopeptidase n=1 Tax=Citricoccus TaxID=169133 RepID=UPI000255E1A0|nr:M15 family metallopeptidase [Citricoccus sp. CH26A]
MRGPRRRVLAALALGALLLSACSPGEPAASSPDAATGSPTSTPSSTSPAAATSAPSTSATPPRGSATATGPAAPPSSSSAPAASSAAPASVPSGRDGHRNPSSVHVLVNKHNPLQPADWAPADLTVPEVRSTRAGLTLRAEAATAAEALFAAAAEDGVDLSLVSAYRSYSYQQGTYAGWVQQHGRTGADRISARPGHSEHQTGLAMDVGAADGACTLEQCFGDTPEGAWVARHAAAHGWIVRYPAGAEDVTGYSPEPWHLRYVGTPAAADVVRSGGVLETAWGFAHAPDYR